jgi:phospholipase C
MRIQRSSGTSKKPTRMTRRQLLTEAGRLGLSAAAAMLMPLNLFRALAKKAPKSGSLRDIKHIVLLMQENRSFDHYLGTLAGVRGFDDPNALKLANGRSVFYQSDVENPDGYTLPFHLNTRTSNAQKIPSTDHSWQVQHESWNRGQMDRWLPAHRKADGINGPYVMGHYNRTDIPFHFALAETFTLCDAYHCSVMGPTWPNRMYLMTGMIDATEPHIELVLANGAPDNGFGWTTYAERLERAGVSWKVYQQEDNYDCNVLEAFRVFRQSSKGSSLYARGMLRGPEGQFEYDAFHDKLPAVSWIIPTSFQSEHPDYIPADGAAFVASKIDAIASNPDVWAKTLFVLNYDENDGLFDHVPPPFPPDGTPREFLNGLPFGAGFRVPCILVSPWTTGGRICTERFDHTSVLQLLETFTGVREPNISDWRRRTFANLASAIQFGGRKSESPSLPDTTGALILAKYESTHLPNPVLPSGNQELPNQEKKHSRPRR